MTVALVLVAAALGLVVAWGSRRWVDAEAGRATPVWAYALVSATLSAAAAWRFGWTWDLPAYLYLALVSGPLTFIDLRAHRLPNILTLSAYPVVAMLLAVPAVVDGRGDDYLRAVLGGAVVLVFYLVLHLVNPAGMGLGDVKLAGPLGGLLGWLSWSVVLVGGFLGFALGAVVGVALLVVRRAGRKTALPFGPFMLAGAWIAILASEAISTAGLLP